MKLPMKKLVLGLGLMVASGSAMASIPGYYAGLQLGQSISDIGSGSTSANSNTLTLSKHDRQGVGAKVFVGYSVTPFYAMELGLARYGEATWNTTENGNAIAKTKFQAYSVDLLGKFTWHLNDTINVYTKAGAAFVRAHYKDRSSNFNLTDNEYFLRPELAVGAAVAISPDLSINANYSRILGKGSTGKMLRKNSPTHYLPNLNLMSIGITYAY